jgi:hypothetical protein
MWFVILKALLPEGPIDFRRFQVPGSAQLEMLLVADDANAAYSNPRPLPKCAQTLLPCIPRVYRTRQRPDAVSAPLKKHIPACWSWY